MKRRFNPLKNKAAKLMRMTIHTKKQSSSFSLDVQPLNVLQVAIETGPKSNHL